MKKYLLAFQYRNNQKYGYSAIELMLVLCLVGLVMGFTLQYSSSLMSLTKAEKATQQAYNYSQAVIRYINTHQNLLMNKLSNNGQGNGLIATVSPQVLKNEGFIKNDAYDTNNLKQYPCTIIYYDKNQLQSFIYYRSDGNDIKLDERQLKDGLNHMGAMIGLYESGIVLGAAKDWQLEPNFIQQMFVKQGTVDIAADIDPAVYDCSGSIIAKSSYVVNVTSMLTLNNKLPKDDTIHQYQDQLHSSESDLSNNRMNTDLKMDYENPYNHIHTKSNVVFQLNESCVIDPTDLATLQDYNPNIGGGASSRNPNDEGCKNRQLGLAVDNDINGNTNMIITGFQQGGYNYKTQSKDSRPFVGEINASSLQPTAKVLVGAACGKSEVGKMAQQQKSPNESDVNNIYVSQVICMKSPLCTADTNGFCYMPVQTVTIRYFPNSPTATCPVGTFLESASIESNVIDITNHTTCVANKRLKIYSEVDCVANGPIGGGYVFDDYLNSVDAAQSSLYRTVTIMPTKWNQHCGNAIHIGCDEGYGFIGDTQNTITQVDCTNDPSKASIVIPVN